MIVSLFAKKPYIEWIDKDTGYIFARCPTCNEPICPYCDKCVYCGQRLDWSEHD